MFEYSRREVYGRNLEFLAGVMTDLDEYEIILEGLKTQIRSEEVTLFLHDQENRPMLVQVILLPNLSKYRGLALTSDCLNQDFIGQIALEQEEAIASGTPGTGISSRDFKNQSKVKNDWRISNKELSYHLLRFGIVCQPFEAYQRQHIQFRKQEKAAANMISHSNSVKIGTVGFNSITGSFKFNPSTL